LLLPTSGSAWINGFNVTQDENKVRGSVGCMLMGERGLYWKLTGRENLEYFGALYHLDLVARKKRSNQIIAMLKLDEIADRMVESYSSGQKMNLAFGKALINDAPLLVLDEPTNTLDVPSASELRAIVRQLNEQGKTVIYTTHIMSEAETLCDRVAIIDRGKLLALGTVEELKTSLQREGVTHIEGVIPSRAADAVRSIPSVVRATRTAQDGGALLTVVTASGREILPQLIEVLTRSGAVIQKITPEELTLEDVFITKTGRTLAEDTRLMNN
jgi:ABC-2 type transport system ATP-binding protein